MKKIAFMFVAVAAIAFASCTGNKAEGEATVEDSAAVETVDSAAVEVEDSTATDSTVVEDSAAVETPDSL